MADPVPPRNRKAEQSEATRAELIRVARDLFAKRGYAAVGTEEIAQAAGVTRGALYHQFKGKEQLFEAVFEAVEADLSGQIAQAAVTAGATDPLGALRAGAAAFLDASLDPGVQRIVLIDAPAVLGWLRWREIGGKYALGLVEQTLEAAMEAGQLARQPAAPLSHVLIGAIDEAALMVAQSDDVAKARAEAGAAVDLLLDGIAASGAG